MERPNSMPDSSHMAMRTPSNLQSKGFSGFRDDQTRRPDNDLTSRLQADPSALQQWADKIAEMRKRDAAVAQES